MGGRPKYRYFTNEILFIYNVVLVSGVQQIDSVIQFYIYIYIYMNIYIKEYLYTFFFRFFSIIGYYKIFSIVPCAIQ